MRIQIDWTSDSMNCDTCGFNWAQGADIYFDNELKLKLVPFAHCYGGDDYDSDTVYQRILEALGHTLEINT